MKKNYWSGGTMSEETTDMIKKLILATMFVIGLMPWRTYAWNSSRHQQYEDELADWWVNNRDIIYEEIPCTKQINTFKKMPLIGLWAMNKSGSKVIDETGNGHSLDEEGSLDYSTLPDPCVTYLTVNSATEGLKTTAVSGINPPAGVLTYGGWFRFHEIPQQHQFKVIMGIEEVFELELSNYLIRPVRYDEGGTAAWVVSNQTLLADTWYFIAVKEEPTGTTLYVNDERLYGANPAGLDFTENLGKPFRIGGKGEVAEFSLKGDYAYTFLSHQAVPDSQIEFVYANTRDTFQNKPVVDAIELYQSIEGLVAFWSMSSTTSGNGQILDDAENKLHLTVQEVSELEQLTSVGGMPFIRRTHNGTIGASTPTTAELEISDEITIGMWVKVGNTTTGGAIAHKGVPSGSQTFIDYSYSLSNDAEAGFFADFKDQSGASHHAEIISATDPIAMSWNFVVARYKKGQDMALTMNLRTERTAVPNQGLASTSEAFYLPAGMSNGEDPTELDLSLVFIADRYLTDSELINLYKKTRGLFR
jgi:hypothetical protein